MKNRKIKQREEKRKVYFVSCPICKKEIKGTSVSQVEYNLKLHLEKHKKEKRF